MEGERIFTSLSLLARQRLAQAGGGGAAEDQGFGQALEHDPPAGARRRLDLRRKGGDGTSRTLGHFEGLCWSYPTVTA
jgi:hypothetical protein